MIYLVRHGETEFNRQDRVQGRLDSPLTEDGEAQGRAAAERLRSLSPVRPADWILQTSPLGRAWRTADIIAGVMAIGPPIVDERLREVSYGELEGLAREEVDRRWPQFAGLTGIFGRAPGGETFEALIARVGAWLADAEAASIVRPLIAVAHAGVIRALRGLYLGLSIEATRALDKPQHAIYALGDGRVERIETTPLPSADAGR